MIRLEGRGQITEGSEGGRAVEEVPGWNPVFGLNHKSAECRSRLPVVFESAWLRVVQRVGTLVGNLGELTLGCHQAISTDGLPMDSRWLRLTLTIARLSKTGKTGTAAVKGIIFLQR